jgi:uncharacterized cupredoxin-like copper-binding protein
MLKRALPALTCFLAGFLAVLAAPTSVRAAGDLAIKATELEPLKLGSKESDYAMSVKEYTLETGKSYSLEISAYGYKDYDFAAEDFFRNIWIRYLEAGGVTIDTPVISEIEFEEEGKVELVFVPIRTGTYEFKIEGLEEKGMVGKFVVK